MRLLFILIGILLPFISQTQVQIQVRILQSVANQATLYRFHKGKAHPIDTVSPVSPGVFHFTLQEGSPQALYRVAVGKNTAFNIVVDKNESLIDANTYIYAPDDSLRSEQSINNNLYWNYQRLKTKADQQGWLIRTLQDFYPDSIPFHQQLSNELISVQEGLMEHVTEIQEKYPEALASEFIVVEQHPVIYHDSVKQSEKRLLEYWWDDIDLFNLSVANSPGFIDRLWGYVEQLLDDNLDKEAQDQAFIEGITLLLLMEMDSQVRAIIRDAIVEGMLETDYTEVGEHFQTLALADLQPLVDVQDRTMLGKDGSRVKVGETAYDFYVDYNGKRQRLSKLEAEYKLILFWSSWCSYCIESMPEIVQVYRDYKDQGLEVIAVSIDKETELWLSHIQQFDAGWIDIHEPFIPEAPLFRMYNVHETPKMFLLDSDLTIISRPTNRRQLEVKLRRMVRWGR